MKIMVKVWDNDQYRDFGMADLTELDEIVAQIKRWGLEGVSGQVPDTEGTYGQFELDANGRAFFSINFTD